MSRRPILTFLALPALLSGVALAAVQLSTAGPSANAGDCVPVPGCCPVESCAPATAGVATMTPAAPTRPGAGDPCAGQPTCCLSGC